MGHVSPPKTNGTNSQQFTGLIAPLVAAGPHPNIALEEADSLARDIQSTCGLTDGRRAAIASRSIRR
jgi:hypothetical protein